ncbi:hypothetical protein MU0083_000669 [[Mycobacterium] kokjensenii]|uniref:Transposase n=1 Tax=[Mycobacterium] kokjensenii TaxID=3064287 RepID=A0ABM9L7R3_9MYCO|nr:hypothetical protein [Mycolicibacter sp. MU0083]CAJ1494132.1 hypothetical protein MU0083_000669 [Mycolicibacter sp. MU0083]
MDCTDAVGEDSHSSAADSRRHFIGCHVQAAIAGHVIDLDRNRYAATVLGAHDIAHPIP